MRLFSNFIIINVLLFSAVAHSKQTEDFNYGWKFHLGDLESAFTQSYNDKEWKNIRIPHDWQVGLPYTKENAASSTGFKAGGIGWYRKAFQLEKNDLAKIVWLEFDGIYNNSKIWVNGRFAGERPNGYSSFSVPITHLMKDGRNTVAVQVDHSAYADSRWYTGAGIYRDVRLVKANTTHIPQWGIKILTHSITSNTATIAITTQIEKNRFPKKYTLKTTIYSPQKEKVSTHKQTIAKTEKTLETTLTVKNPQLWQLDSPSLYSAEVVLMDRNKIIDSETVLFGIRSFRFDANKGFFLNEKQTKIKGVNLHHDAGAIGAAVPKAVWRYRLEKLRSIGVNAIRMSHNPHSTGLLDLCDEMGFLAIAEAFDDWERSKAKSIHFLSDNAGTGAAVESYNLHFNQWAEQDLKDMIHRDFNHPSIIMWSIGNEIEWTYPYYKKSLVYKQKRIDGYRIAPHYDPVEVEQSFKKNLDVPVDNLAITAKRLAAFVKEVDTSRPVTAGLVIPSVDFISGYTDVLDVAGFNYRAVEYDIAHKTYPNKPIYGSENWGSWPEWKAVLDREFIPGIFVWTGFAYKGEAGPWPRKGLEISFFDFAGNKTPRGHQFESFWVDKPKTYLATIPADKSEYQWSADKGWYFTERVYTPKKMQWLRPWEWFNVEERWNYKANENIIVHVYSNTDISELFLNGKSLGRQKINDDNDRILFWKVPFEAGELKVVGYAMQNTGEPKPQASYSLHTHGSLSSIDLTSSKNQLTANDYDVSYVHVQLKDENGFNIVTADETVEFEIQGPARLLAVDNGNENSVELETGNSITTHQGRASALVQATQKEGAITVRAKVKSATSTTTIISKRPSMK